MDDIRAKWLSHLLSTAPADRAAAEGGLRKLYVAAGYPEPKIFFWFGSPFRAAGAAALLCAEADLIWKPLVDSMNRVRKTREWLDRLRAEMMQVAGASDWASLVQAAGGSITQGHMRRGGFVTKTLQSPVTMAHIGLYKDVAASGKWLDQKDPFYIAERSFRGVLSGQGQWSAINPMLGQSFNQNYMFITAALDEMELGTRAAPQALEGAWAVARAAGLWWPFENSVVISDRPSEVHLDDQTRLHRGDGAAIAFRDGERAWAWEGRAMREEWIMQPENIPPRELKLFEKSFRDYATKRTAGGPAKPSASKISKVFAKELAGTVEKKIEALREHNKGSLPCYDRYLAGEHDKVWAELNALGGSVRADPHAADALAVAYETMRRVGANVEVVAARLKSLDYDFAHEPHMPPGRKTFKNITKLEKTLGMLPLSLRAFYEVVGSVDWIGHHSKLAREDDTIASDPLVVYSVEVALDDLETLDDEAGGAAVIAPDDLHKANVSGGSPYEIAVPELAADGKVLNERHDLHFVDYLRLVFRFGGFPGYEGVDSGLPPEIDALKQGLLAF